MVKNTEILNSMKIKKRDCECECQTTCTVVAFAAGMITTCIIQFIFFMVL